MKPLGKIICIIMTFVFTLSIAMTLVGCENKELAALTQQITQLQEKVDALETKSNNNQTAIDGISKDLDTLSENVGGIQQSIDLIVEEAESAPFDYTEECYKKIKYIDQELKDRDCYTGEKSIAAQNWILNNLYAAGYTEEEAFKQTFVLTNYYKEATLSSSIPAVESYELADDKHYSKSGRRYTENEDGEYVKVNVTLNNIVAVKKGKTDEQIIVGMHFDGDGTGDNGSGVALGLTAAEHIYNFNTNYTIVFIFFNAEEYGCYGSTAYANGMSEEEVAKTKYMINMDSLVCGDYCNLYGGVQDDDTQTVKDTEAYDNAMKVAESLGLEFHTNPWTYENPAPGYETPDYASPSTGDWSDHKGFKNIGIKYLYFEATNWYIPGPYNEYDGYGETYLIGMLMNTPNDYLEYIETYFPGRIQSHISKFATLLNALLLQPHLDF